MKFIQVLVPGRALTLVPLRRVLTIVRADEGQAYVHVEPEGKSYLATTSYAQLVNALAVPKP